MRETFHAELDTLIGDLASTARLAGQMMTNASVALHHVDLELAESVISGKGELKTLCDDIDQRCVKLLVLQAPLATDLRIVVATMHAVGDLQRMGHLAQHIAKIARMKHPGPADPGRGPSGVRADERACHQLGAGCRDGDREPGPTVR